MLNYAVEPREQLLAWLQNCRCKKWISMILKVRARNSVSGLNCNVSKYGRLVYYIFNNEKCQLRKKILAPKFKSVFSSSDCKIIKSYNCICHFHRSAKKTASCGRLWLEGSTVLSLQRSNWKWRKISLFMAINQIHLPCYFFCATTPNHIMRAKTSLIHCWSSSDQGLVYYHFYLSLVCCYCTIKCKQSSLSLMMANRHLISKTFFF